MVAKAFLRFCSKAQKCYFLLVYEYLRRSICDNYCQRVWWAWYSSGNRQLSPDLGGATALPSPKAYWAYCSGHKYTNQWGGCLYSCNGCLCAVPYCLKISGYSHVLLRTYLGRTQFDSDHYPEALIDVFSKGYRAKDLAIELPFYLSQCVKDVVVLIRWHYWFYMYSKTGQHVKFHLLLSSWNVVVRFWFDLMLGGCDVASGNPKHVLDSWKLWCLWKVIANRIFSGAKPLLFRLQSACQ